MFIFSFKYKFNTFLETFCEKSYVSFLTFIARKNIPVLEEKKELKNVH